VDDWRLSELASQAADCAVHGLGERVGVFVPRLFEQVLGAGYAPAVSHRCDYGRMTAWLDVEQAEPEFAQRVRALFDARRHKTIATLRADGSPRISGIEAVFEGGELVFGSMPNARKGADLRRDPRFALHSATVDPVEGSEAQWPGEAKISGRAIAAGAITEGADGDRFHIDIAEVVHTHLNEEATVLVVEWWTPTHGLRRIERE
jgi:Pyridoxamine 5'-phosphate oxidase